jgi:hypothetical protein
MGETCGTHVREEICVQISVGKPKVKRPLGRPWRRRGYFSTDLRETGQEGLELIYLAQDRGKVACFCEQSNKTAGPIKCRTFA